MIADFLFDAGETTEFHADICVVGAGAAGLTLAHHVAASGTNTPRVLVVEAGGRDSGADDADWLAGETENHPFDGFEGGRARAYGGATRRWFGQCIRLDPIDFSRRDWVPNSGWPITAADVSSWYEKAEQFLGIAPHGYGPENWTRSGVTDPGFAGDNDVEPKFTIYCPQPDFTKTDFSRRMKRNDFLGVKILLNAAATGLLLDADGRRVTGLRIRGGAREGIVRARAYVLCGGGIENPRLLLASNDVMARGIGNDHDLVGRFFQDHPGGATGTLVTATPRRAQKQFSKLRRDGLMFWPKLALTEAAQRRGKLLNANAQLSYDYAENSAMFRAKALVAAARARRPAAAAVAALRVVPHAAELFREGFSTLARGNAPVLTPKNVFLTAHVEQIPDPDNRIMLSENRDRFGVPRPRLAWRINPAEVATLRAITDAAGSALRRRGFGDMSPLAWLDDPGAARKNLADTYHHAGATRMAETPRDGVVDPDCRVFGVDNLFVAGSSVFPTSGYANPTLTIVALAIRLAETLRRRFFAAG